MTCDQCGALPVNNNGRPPITWEGANGPCEERHGDQCRCGKCVKAADLAESVCHEQLAAGIRLDIAHGERDQNGRRFP